MLILTLKEKNKILIGKKIKVLIVNIDEEQVLLGIELPSEMTVKLEELSQETNNTQIIEHKKKLSSKSLIQILEEEDPALAELIRKKK